MHIACFQFVSSARFFLLQITVIPIIVGERQLNNKSISNIVAILQLRDEDPDRDRKRVNDREGERRQPVRMCQNN